MRNRTIYAVGYAVAATAMIAIILNLHVWDRSEKTSRLPLPANSFEMARFGE